MLRDTSSVTLADMAERIQKPFDAMTWEERFYFAFDCFLTMEARAERAERQLPPGESFDRQHFSKTYRRLTEEGREAGFEPPVSHPARFPAALTVFGHAR